MRNVKVPQSVQNQLLDGENVIAKNSSTSGDYYATEKRLLKFISGSNCQAIEYGPKVSITLIELGIGWFMLRLILFIMGIVLLGFGTFFYIGPDISFGSTVVHWKGDFEIVLFSWIIGLASIVVGLFYQHAYYQIRTQDMDKKELKKWRILRRHMISGNLDRFAKTVGERLSQYAED